MNSYLVTLVWPTFCSCDLDLDPISLIYKDQLNILKIYLRIKQEGSRSRLSKCGTQTGHTDMTECIKMTHLWEVTTCLDEVMLLLITQRRSNIGQLTTKYAKLLIEMWNTELNRNDNYLCKFMSCGIDHFIFAPYFWPRTYVPNTTL